MQAHGGLERYENGTVNLTGRNNHEKQIAVRLHQLEFHLGKITDGETQTLAAEAIAAQIATWPSGYKTAIYQKLKREIEPKKL